MSEFEAPDVDPSVAIRRRYTLALSLVALLLAGSQVAIQLTLARGDDDSRLINVSGRQRMLCEEIAKLALEIEEAPDVSGRIAPVKELYEALMIFQGTHRGLLDGSATLGVDGHNSPQILALYSKLEPSYRVILDAASSLRVRAVAPDVTATEIRDLTAKIMGKEGEFLISMDTVVWRYDEEASQRRSFIRNLEYLLFGLTIVALMMEALFIFRPAEKYLSRYFQSLHRAMAKLREQATYDSLTGLYNRGAGILLLEHEMDKARRASSPLSLVFIDLDGLKTVNDNLGHDEGDRFIAGFAKIVAGAIRSGDMAFRYGGDEFILVLNCDIPQAENIATRVRALVDEANTQKPGAWAFGFSYGITSFNPESTATADLLLAAADEAMYTMKEEHRRSGRSPLRN
ncbi:MAG: diguanylate cyclase [Treponema sp.]|nr:diguanylate cyclase [Treponema sp.]